MVVINYDDSEFMVHFKLACVRHNVLMRQKLVGNYAHQSDHRSCVMGHTGLRSVE